MNNVTYDRKERQYVVCNGEGEVVKAFPSGNNGRREAHRFAISVLNPQLTNMVQQVSTSYPNWGLFNKRVSYCHLRGQNLR